MIAIRQIAALLFAGLLVHQAYAQYGGGFPGGSMRGGMRGGMSRGDARNDRSIMPQRPADPDAIDDQLGLLEEALNLNQTQWPLWQRYADRVRALASDIARERRRVETTEKQSAVQQVNHAVDTARNRLAALEDIAAAAAKLYATLDSGQQAIADARLAGMVLNLSGNLPPGFSGRSTTRD